ncbi:MAG: hypothetical protein EOO41_03455 [Methanobacteriota archaeon]|nr:MAG: hypothetical protein EOO41_03455 [Euryarchaeota archaeon]
MNAAPEGQQDAAAAAGDSSPRVSGGAAFSHAELHAALHSLLRQTGMEVMRVQRVPDGAHVRRGIRDKTYVYSLAWPTPHAAAPAVPPRTPCPPPFLNPVTLQANTWVLPAPLQTDAMCAAARAFVGTHDFSSFRASGCSAHSAVKRLDDVRLVLAPPPPAASALAAPEGCAGGGGTLPTECGLLGSNAAYHDIHAAMGLPRYGLQHAYLVVTGHSFLYHMVRNIVGLLVAVGSGKYEPDVVHRVLAAGSRAAIPYVTAPAHGLTLASIRYEADDTAPGAAAQVLIDAAAHDNAVSVGAPPGELR